MLDVLGKILGILLILFVVLGVLGVLALALGTRAGRKKLLQLIVVLLVVTFFSFSLLHLTSDVFCPEPRIGARCACGVVGG